MINNFHILAERNSGTNYIERLIPKAFDIPITFDFGPKHFMGLSNEAIAKSNDTLFLCLVRNPYDWLTALFNAKHHVPFHMTTFEKFLLSEWYSIHHSKGHPDYGKERMDDRYWMDNTRHKNICEMRSRKFKYLKHDITNLAKNRYHIRYEDLCNNISGVLTDMSYKFNLNLNKNYENPIKKPPYKIPKYHLNIINENIDWETESLFDYEIDKRVY